MTETVGDFLDAAWDAHAGDPAGVAARLPAAMAMLEREPAQAGAFLQFAEHLLLGHLGDPDALEPWLSFAASIPDAAPALERARLAAHLMRGGELLAGAQPAAVQVRALGTAANGFATRGDIAIARRMLDTAASLARAPGAPAEVLRALAAGYNNLATQLLEGRREPEADRLMMDTAHASRDTWQEAGTWLNVERAEYLLALCAAAIGDATQAVGHAEACLSICAAHDADAFERFFGHEALARALLARGDRVAAGARCEAMQTLLPAVADDLRAHAQSSLDQLQRLVNPA
jgi:hypothetical protein